ncbi:hypothetical protein KXW65_001279 [Aspergillus fumigatus]|nr:hypothetical protein KXW65_001279 [Aspergillus fumigatus]
MASFFREVGRINGQLYVGATPISNVAVRHDPMHPFDQYDNERDGDNAVQWLFDRDAEDEAVDYDEQNNVIHMRNCPSCRRWLEAGQRGLCLGCEILAFGGMVLFMFYLKLVSPIRVALIGLSGATDYEGAAWAASAQLPFLQRSEHFTITAMLNSSVRSAQAAIESTTSQRIPRRMAPQVDRHFQTVHPSLEAGKTVFVEWPLDRNLDWQREWLRWQLLTAQRLCRTTGFLLAGYPQAAGRREYEAPNLSRQKGGSKFYDVHVGHSLESVISDSPMGTALGEFKPFTSSCAISRPRLDIVNYADGGKWSRTQCATQLQITFSFMAQQSQMRSAPSACTQGMPGLPRLDWRIQRERGWLRVASLGYLNVGTPETKLELSHTDSGRVEELKVDKDEWILCQSLVKILRDYTRHIAEGSRILHSAGL